MLTTSLIKLVCIFFIKMFSGVKTCLLNCTDVFSAEKHGVHNIRNKPDCRTGKHCSATFIYSHFSLKSRSLYCHLKIPKML